MTLFKASPLACHISPCYRSKPSPQAHGSPNLGFLPSHENCTSASETPLASSTTFMPLGSPIFKLNDPTSPVSTRIKSASNNTRKWDDLPVSAKNGPLRVVLALFQLYRHAEHLAGTSVHRVRVCLSFVRPVFALSSIQSRMYLVSYWLAHNSACLRQGKLTSSTFGVEEVYTPDSFA